MRALLALSFCLGLLLSPSGATAQEAAAQPLQIGPSGEAYLGSVRYRGIETDVGYYDPTGAVPRLETGQAPASPKNPRADGGGAVFSSPNVLIILVISAILIGLAILVMRASGSFTLSLQGDAQNPTRLPRNSRGSPANHEKTLADLHAILTTADRRLALVLLAQAALARTVAANGVLFQPSWTMRDALRHIPKGQHHLDALRNLVIAGERVLFGNRDVTEAEFQAQVATIRPLMSQAAP